MSKVNQRNLLRQVAAVVIGLAVLIRWLTLERDAFTPRHCLHRNLNYTNNATHASHLFSTKLNGECYFALGYEDAVSSYTALASYTNGVTITHKVYSTETYNYTTRTTVFKGHPQKYLVHISGTHGVEAYAGAAIQNAILEYIQATNFYTNDKNLKLLDVKLSKKDKNITRIIRNQDLPTLVLVHVLNPFGFKNNRRVNENNVDLNRNFLTDEEFKYVKNRDPNYAGYTDVNYVLNPTVMPTNILFLNDLMYIFVTLKALLTHGFLNLKRAIVSGNYHKSNGLGFGGLQRDQSTKNLINYLVNDLKIKKTSKSLLLVDVHSGLGDLGVDSFHPTVSENHYEDFTEIFPVEFDVMENKIGGITADMRKAGETRHKSHVSNAVTKKTKISSSNDVFTGYELTVGMVARDFCKNYLVGKNDKKKDFMCLTQEFGTWPSVIVAKVSRFTCVPNLFKDHIYVHC